MLNKCFEDLSKEAFDIFFNKLKIFFENQENPYKNYVLSEIVKRLDGLKILATDNKSYGHKVFCTFEQGKSLFKIRLVPFDSEYRLVYRLQSEISLKL